MNIEKLLIFFLLLSVEFGSPIQTKNSKAENDENQKERHPKLSEDEKKNFDKIIENTKQSKQGNYNFIHYVYNAVKNTSIDQMNDLINFWKKEHKD
uniref:Uncharacterized protein n=2 Tax=Meloidogyne TaxID=189290 RepID=A0A6V7WDH5_MELEN|nr:unnamed protein product [Meloidogyne enterolobii]CAD2206162.1 unnamed protein product [Meloidogyne enterolobii]